MKWVWFCSFRKDDQQRSSWRSSSSCAGKQTRCGGMKYNAHGRLCFKVVSAAYKSYTDTEKVTSVMDFFLLSVCQNCLSVPDIKTTFSDCAPKIGKRDCLVQPCSALSGYVWPHSAHQLFSVLHEKVPPAVYNHSEWRVRKYGAVVIKNTAETVCSCTKNQQLLLLLNHISLNDYLYNSSGQLFAHVFFCVFQGRGERGHWMDGQMCDTEHSPPTQTKRHYIERPLGVCVCVSEVLSCKFRDLMDESTVVINLPPHWRYRSCVTLYWSDTGKDGVWYLCHGIYTLSWHDKYFLCSDFFTSRDSVIHWCIKRDEVKIKWICFGFAQSNKWFLF